MILSNIFSFLNYKRELIILSTASTLFVSGISGVVYTMVTSDSIAEALAKQEKHKQSLNVIEQKIKQKEF